MDFPVRMWCKFFVETPGMVSMSIGVPDLVIWWVGPLRITMGCEITKLQWTPIQVRIYEVRLSQSRSGSEPPHKRSRNSQSGDLMASNRSQAVGKMFYKTRLCSKFRVGTCPYITNCNFAHSLEELRKPPPNWQGIVAAHEEELGVSSGPREECQIPILGVSNDIQRSYKRHCKKFYTEEGCPYGENCTFLHDEQSKARESVAISLGPSNGNGSTLNPSKWENKDL